MKSSDTDITIIGLGPGDPKLLTQEAWQELLSVGEIYLRTNQHPITMALPANLSIRSFDGYYQKYDRFEEVYEKIVAEVIKLARRDQGVVYGVPGDPMVAEATTVGILERAGLESMKVRLIHGVSFLEPVFSAIGIDPVPRLVVSDAMEIAASHHPSFPPDYPALIAQIYSRSLANDVKLTLMGNYVDDYPVSFIHQAGSPDQIVERLELYEIDRSEKIGALSCLFIPPISGRISFESFQDLIAHLRAPEGCPWDRAQTHSTLRPYLLEETYEVLTALDGQNPRALMEELGDLLIQVVLHTQIAAEDGEFMMTDVIRNVSDKLVYRHPHVFGDLSLKTPEAVKQHWERLKEQERQANGLRRGGALEGVPTTLPALAQADTYQKRAARLGFDWPELNGVIEKIREELDEVLVSENLPDLTWEIGDLLFAVVNLARWYDLDPESILRQANARFRNRFERIEMTAEETHRSVADMTLEEMEKIWQEAKKNHPKADNP
jgi:tetrapyrrole methylase family protein / MazG family protein